MASAGDIAPPDEEKLAQLLYEDHRHEPDPEEDAIWDGYVRKVLSRAHKHAGQPLH